MRYLTLVEALVVAEAVTGISSNVLGRSARVGLLDSALHAPAAEFGGQEFYPDFVGKAAVLAGLATMDSEPPPEEKAELRSTVAVPLLIETLRRAVPAGMAVESPARASAGVGPASSELIAALATAVVAGTDRAETASLSVRMR